MMSPAEGKVKRRAGARRRRSDPPAPSAPNILRETPQLRLARLVNWCLTGQLAPAMIELHDWLRERGCPIEARLLLASLLSRAGRHDEALLALPRPGQIGAVTDQHLLQMTAAVLEAAGQSNDAARVMSRLVRQHAGQPSLDAWLSAMDGPVPPQDQQAHGAQVEQLIAQLADQPQVIPSLVFAQALEPDAETIALLRAAIPPATDALDDPRRQLMVSQAMAQLAELAADRTDARLWAQRGLSIDPYAATLALLLARLAEQTRDEPLVVQTLEHAIHAHPTYPDLRVAVIRHQMRAGRTDAARAHLQAWRDEQPEHPMARQMHEELAA